MSRWPLVKEAMNEAIKITCWDDPRVWIVYSKINGKWYDQDGKHFEPSFAWRGWRRWEPRVEQLTCPKCGSPYVSRERRPYGNTECRGCGFETTSKHWDELAKKPKTVTMWQPVVKRKGIVTNHIYYAAYEDKIEFDAGLGEQVLGWIRHEVELSE